MALIGYARVSTQDQSRNLQLDALKKVGCARIFEETASGAIKQRTELSKALEFVRAGDALVVWRLDRLARSLPHLIETVALLNERQCEFQSLTEAIDTTSSTGRLIFHIFGALAEFERSVIRDRTLAGLAAAKARGKVGGRPRKFSDEKVKAARTLLQDGTLTIAEIADQLGISAATIYKNMPSPRTNFGTKD